MKVCSRLDRALQVALVLILLQALSAQVCFAVVYVKADSPGSTLDGNSWETAYHTIQAGLNDADITDEEVWVAAGTYVERITLKSGVALKGGYSGVGETRDIRSYVTVVESLDKQTTITVTGADQASIDGFTIRGGGSGINCGGVSPTITNNIIIGSGVNGIRCHTSQSRISGNRIISSEGAGISCYSSTVEIIGNTISGHYYQGIYLSGTSYPAKIIGNVISGNNYSGIYCDSSSPIIACNIISANVDGINLYNSGPAVVNNTFVKNSGIGIDCKNSSYPGIHNNIISFNAIGISKDAGSTPTLKRNDVFGNTTNYTGLTAGSTDISADPQFTSVFYGNWHISAGSPCRNNGDGSISNIPTADIDSQPRVEGASIDIGADESYAETYSAVRVVYVNATAAAGGDGKTWATAYRTIQSGVDDLLSNSGGEVWVAKGTYTGQVRMRPFAHMYGGFSGSETSREARNWKQNITTIDAGVYTDNFHTVYGANYSTLDGFYLRRGDNSVYCYKTSPTITNNDIVTTADHAILCDNASPVITNNFIKTQCNGVNSSFGSPIIRDNYITDWMGNGTGILGTGVHCYQGTPVVTGNTIAGGGIGIYASTGTTASGNTIRDCSTGVKCYQSPVVTNNRIFASASYGIECYQASPTISGNIIYGCNSAIQYASGKITNNTISGNGVGIDCRATGTPALANNIISFNNIGIRRDTTVVPALNRNNVYGNATNYSGISAGASDISVDPQFASFQDGDFHIEADSLCRNAGNGTAVGIPAVDIDGQIRPEGPAVDLGADESYGEGYSVAPRIVYVNAAVAAEGDGTSWETAYKTIGRAVIDVLVKGPAEIWVARGMYKESVTMGVFTRMYGGFSGSETSIDQRNLRSNRTMIQSSNGSVAVSGASFSRVDGFVIRAGGVYNHVSAHFSIANNNISAGGERSGMSLSGSGIADVTNNIVWGSSNGISCSGEVTARITNNTFAGNAVGIDNYSGKSTITNNIVAFNSGNGIQKQGASQTTLSHNDVFGNGTNYSGITAGTGDISSDPQFGSFDYTEFHIQPTSPCRNSGDSYAPSLPDRDVDRQARIEGVAVDIGADESYGESYSPASRVIYVNSSSAGGDGRSWATAYKTLQAATDDVDMNGPADVRVAGGVYTGKLIIRPFSYLYGGYNGSGEMADVREWKSNPSHIDAADTTADTWAVGCSGRSIIDGFVIRGGYHGVMVGSAALTLRNTTITGNAARGVHCSASKYFVEMSNCVISANGQEGIYCYYNSAPIISGCNIVYNTGYGIKCENSSSPIIKGNTINSNGQGGIHCSSSSSPTIISNKISQNTGYGVFSDNSAPKIAGNLIADNTGYGAYLNGYGPNPPYPSLINNTIVKNTNYGVFAHVVGPGIQNNIIAYNSYGVGRDYGSTASMYYNDVYGNTNRDYSGIPKGTGDISVDPLFENVTGKDYHLTSASECIDKCLTDTSAGLLVFDIDNEGRTFHDKLDMGADEYWPNSLNTGETKKAADGAFIKGSGAIVTAVFGDAFYVEAEDSSAGIRVEMPGHSLAAGIKCGIFGTLDTTSDGERVILATSAFPTGSGSVGPVALTNKSLGGGPLSYNPLTGAGQMGVEDGDGLNNIGLLIKTTGRVTAVGDNFFYVDDGTHARDKSIFVGVRIRCPNLVKPQPGKQVSVTGISRIIQIRDRYFRCLSPRSSQDIQVID